jgi:hypothetical protein
MKEIVNMKTKALYVLEPHRINITKYRGNTHYNIHVIDSFGQEHHSRFFQVIYNR